MLNLECDVNRNKLIVQYNSWVHGDILSFTSGYVLTITNHLLKLNITYSLCATNTFIKIYLS